MGQKLLGVCFFSTIIVLSYVATLHIITNRVEAIHHTMTAAERSRTVSLSGPVSLRPISDHAPLSGKKYAVRKIAKPARVEKEVIKATFSKGKKKKSDRRPASLNKKHKKKNKSKK